ncbi:MAG: hypothetical protein M3547_03045 [Acidobacteriota bacterium]|nr:hypothetical protein [Acidobacteriota bacterium]
MSAPKAKASGTGPREESRFNPGMLAVTATALAVLLSGCAGFHLYDPEREKLTQAAKKSFETANVSATIAAARENQAALVEAEVAQARRMVQARRNLLLNALAGDDGCEPVLAVGVSRLPNTAAPGAAAAKPPFYERLGACIERELSGLVVIPAGTSHAQMLVLLRGAVTTSDVFSDEMVAERARVRSLFKGLDLPQCVLGTRLPPDASPALLQEAARRAPEEPFDVHYRTFVRHCSTIQDAVSKIAENATGRHLAMAVKEWIEGQAAVDRARAVAASAKTYYEGALAKYEAAAAALERGESKDVRERFAAALDGLKAASEALEKAGGPIGVKAVSEERLDQLDAVIAALKGDQFDPEQYDPRVRQAVGVVATLPAFGDRAIDIARRRQTPPLGPLILEKELHQVRLAAANRQILREEERLVWLERRMTAQRDRAIRLLQARQRLNQVALRLAKGAPCNGDLACGQRRLAATAVEAFSNATPANARVQLRQSVAEYADSFSIDAVAAAEADYRLVSVEYEIALDRSEDAVRQWQTLIAVPIDRLIAYHSAGIKPAEVAAIVTQALGLGAIAVGVNR